MGTRICFLKNIAYVSTRIIESRHGPLLINVNIKTKLRNKERNQTISKSTRKGSEH